GCLHVVNGCRKWVLRGQAVADRDGDVAVLCQADAQSVVALSAAGAEATAVNADDRRQRTLGGLWPGEVELKVLAVRVGVYQSRTKHDARWQSRKCNRLLCRSVGDRK